MFRSVFFTDTGVPTFRGRARGEKSFTVKFVLSGGKAPPAWATRNHPCVAASNKGFL
jgi:hypothetical protein